MRISKRERDAGALPQSEDRLSLIFALIASGFLVLILVFLLLQVFTRYVLGNPLSWTEELARFSFIWFTFAAFAYVTLRGANLYVDIIDRLVPLQIVRILQIMNTLLGIAAATVMAWGAWEFALGSSGLTSTAAQIPLYFVYSAALYGFGIAALHGIASVYILIRKSRSA